VILLLIEEIERNLDAGFGDAQNSVCQLRAAVGRVQGALYRFRVDYSDVRHTKFKPADGPVFG
jgi:hypothetical protein